MLVRPDPPKIAKTKFPRGRLRKKQECHKHPYKEFHGSMHGYNDSEENVEEDHHFLL